MKEKVFLLLFAVAFFCVRGAMPLTGGVAVRCTRSQTRVPSSAGGNSSFELHSQSMEERVTMESYHHFRGHTRACAPD